MTVKESVKDGRLELFPETAGTKIGEPAACKYEINDRPI